MSRISNKEWEEYQVIRGRGDAQPMCIDDIKYSAYESLFELSSAWNSAFGANLREAVYCKWWKVARQMLSTKADSTAKRRALVIIADLEALDKVGGDD